MTQRTNSIKLTGTNNSSKLSHSFQQSGEQLQMGNWYFNSPLNCAFHSQSELCLQGRGGTEGQTLGSVTPPTPQPAGLPLAHPNLSS